MADYKGRYNIVRVGSFPTTKQHGRGRHNLELSRVYSGNTLLITWKTAESLVAEVPDLDIKQLRFYEKSVRSNNVIIGGINRILRLFMLVGFSTRASVLTLSKSPKVVHLHSPMFLAIGIIVKLINFGNTRVLITFHGEDYIHTQKSQILKVIVKTVVDKALFISWTQWHECDFLKHKYWTPNGIQPHLWTKPIESTRKQKSVLLVGKFKPQKNILGLLYSWATLIKKHPDAQLTIVGEGEMENKLKDVIEQLDIRGSVNILPFQNQVELRKLYWQNQIFISNSILEGFAKVVLEAMVCKCKIAVTGVDSHKKVFEGWPFLIEPNSVEDTDQKLQKLMLDDYPWDHHERILEQYNSRHTQSTYKKIIDETL